MESQAKTNEKYMSFSTLYYQAFEGTFHKRIQDTDSLPVPLFLAVLHCIRIYISIYHFYNFSEPNLTFMY